ncbi:MAG: malonyl-ACP O-methyltransferase BioC [Gammaproteobacteria bacterium]|nr:malonyl-ACP O-methyltransferase BioC [Gammaproteobacteria bacterium]
MSGEQRDYDISKFEVRRHFGKAAASYDKASRLQRMVRERLLERLELIKLKPERILDLGSGPGHAASKLVRLYKQARVLEVDISEAMLSFSASKAPRFFGKRQRLCADVEQLGVKDNSVDLVYSNLMLQWSRDLDRAFVEVNRILNNNGLFMFSTFGPDTLLELRKSWQVVDDKVHVNAFVDMHDVGDALIRAGFENPVMEVENITVHYDTVMQIMRDLKTLGANNANSGRRRTLTGKNRLKTMAEEYEKLRAKGKLPVTYEVIYGHAWLPKATQSRRVDDNTVVFPLTGLKAKHRGKP